MPRRTQKKQKKSHFLRNLLIVLGISATVFGTFYIFKSHKSDIITTVNLSTEEPEISDFSSHDNTVLMTSNGLPTVNNNRTLTKIQPVILNYEWSDGPYAPAFKMDLSDQEISKHVKIKPFLPGKWTIRSANSIAFLPNIQWPADKKFNIQISGRIFAKNIAPDTHRATFTTPAPTATLTSFNTYPAPDTKKSVVGVAVISFNYPIITDGFSDRLNVRLDGAKTQYNVKFDKFNRTAIITTSPIAVRDEPQTLRIKLNRIPVSDSDTMTQKITGHTTIASSDNYFKINNISSIIADSPDYKTQQLLTIDTTATIDPKTDWNKHITVYILPQKKDQNSESEYHNWSADEITPTVLKESEKLKITPTDFTAPIGTHQYAFSYTYGLTDRTPRYIYVDIPAGLASTDGFETTAATQTLLPISFPDTSVKIVGDGALLSMSGDKKLTLVARGGANSVFANLYKINAEQINHLVSQTYNVFSPDIEFKSWSFNTYDMAVVFQKRISLNPTDMFTPNYTTLNLGDYLDRSGTDKTGIFIIQTGTTEDNSNFSDRRLILLTDLGIIRKENLDGTSSVFVANFSTGAPSPDTEITILGRNGNAIWAGRTDASGHTEIPAFPWSEYKNARQPVAVVARKNNDVSFIPYNSAYSQRIDTSKFDVGGTYSYTNTPLNAFIFSDRGIYRPGEDVTIGAIVKNKTFKSLAGIPVRLEIEDSRARKILAKNISLSPDGMFDTTYSIPSSAPLGEYVARVYSLNVREKPQDILGQTTFSVQEFTPDTLKISATIPESGTNGWISPENITANISLRTLFGTPAPNREIRATATLRPINYTFDNFKNYTFGDTTITGNISATSDIRSQTYTININDITTTQDGTAQIPLVFDSDILPDTYLLSLNVNGYESASGTGVQTTITTRVSSEKYLVGYHTNSNLSYLNRNSEHSVDLIALDYTATPIDLSDTQIQLVHRETITSLIKDYNNYYKYQTTTRDNIVRTEPLSISKNGATIQLDTTNPGTYFLNIVDKKGNILSAFEYFVAGNTNTDLTTDTNAELQIKLNASQYAPGDTIDINITAPYIGTGLITIERDCVYAHKWFETKTTSSVQSIKIPNDFSGSGYISVSFVRDINSPDIFTTPYTYAITPFSATATDRKISVEINAPKQISGDKLSIEYKTNTNAQIMLFAINQGILQVAKYKIPNPFTHFFQKAALQVETYQILSLLLPEYKILREFAKTGGGDYEGATEGELASPLLNPFARHLAKSVAFYSGIKTTRAGATNTIDFDIPSEFNGTLHIFAVAASENAVGSADTTTIVQHPIIISPNAPLFVAPNDKFDINTVITNQTSDTKINTDIVVPENLTISSPTHQESEIPSNSEHLLVFNTSAGNDLGNATITINSATTDANGNTTYNTSTNLEISVRPTTTFTTNIKSGKIESAHHSVRDISVPMYTQMQTHNLYLAKSPIVLARPLFEYLKKYDFNCTEQLISRTFPYAIAPDNKVLGTTYDKSAKNIADTINALRARQNPDGSFNMWPTNTYTSGPANTDTAILTAYVSDFLTTARENGFAVPDNMHTKALDYLRTFAGETITSDEMANAVAFATYVITRSNFVTTTYINNFTEYADKHMPKWSETISGTYIATCYHLMHQDDAANKLVYKYNESETAKIKYLYGFRTNISNDATYMYLVNKYFDTPVATPSDAILSYINNADYTPYTSATIIVALAAHKPDTQSPEITVKSNGTPVSVEFDNTATVAKLDNNTEKLTFDCPSCTDENPVFFTVIQSGFPTETYSHSNGIEIIREYYNENGDRVSSAKLGDTLTAKISVRATRGNVPNVAIVDLLPGGMTARDLDAKSANFSEIRTDRVLIFTDLTRSHSEYTYTIQITAAGTFQSPSISAMSMYNPETSATYTPYNSTFTVSNAQPD